MLISLFYIFLAAFGLGFLIFIHELGHYFMAKHVGMKVEAFGIGFGKPLWTWNYQGVKWHICWLPFGGYVKIAGMDSDTDQDPYEIPEGFFSKPPIDRIKVALAGPIVNILFAALVFSIIWATGGREKNFGDFSKKIGWLDPKSELYQDGIRPGDEIHALNNQHYQTTKDHLYAPMTAGPTLNVQGYKVNYATGEKLPFIYNIKPYPNPNFLEKDILTDGVLSTANYIIFNPPKSEPLEKIFPEGSPMAHSGIRPGDRLVWADGVMLFSLQQLQHVLNDGKVLLTIQRNGEILQRRIPRVRIEELKLTPDLREEFVDWQHEALLTDLRITKLYAIPYNITADAVVENPLKFIDREKQEEIFPSQVFAAIDEPLLPGDKIIAIDGKPVSEAFQLFFSLQQHRVNLIVQRNQPFLKPDLWTKADTDFDQEVQWTALSKITNSIGSEKPITSSGDLFLLNPIVPKSFKEFVHTPEKQTELEMALSDQKKSLESIEDPEKRAQAIQLFEARERQLVLGLPAIQDKVVNYNPDPLSQFGNVINEIWYTLVAVFSGNLSPKWMAGPIGIVQIIHTSWLVSIKEALFWLGAISLNLGVLNLLPIPVLDGGYICLFLMEMITRKRIKVRSLEKLIIPFAVLLIGCIIYFTYNDLMRLFSVYIK